MIKDLNIIIGQTGHFVLVVPGKVEEGELVLETHENKVVMRADDQSFAEVTNVNDQILFGLNKEGKVAVMEVLDPDNPPTQITHWADVQDKRNAA